MPRQFCPTCGTSVLASTKGDDPEFDLALNVCASIIPLTRPFMLTDVGTCDSWVGRVNSLPYAVGSYSRIFDLDILFSSCILGGKAKVLIGTTAPPSEIHTNFLPFPVPYQRKSSEVTRYIPAAATAGLLRLLRMYGLIGRLRALRLVIAVYAKQWVNCSTSPCSIVLIYMSSPHAYGCTPGLARRFWLEMQLPCSDIQAAAIR